MVNPRPPTSPSLADIRAGRRPPSKRVPARKETHRRLAASALEELTRDFGKEGLDFYARLHAVLGARDRDAFHASAREAIGWFERNTGISPVVEEAARVEPGAMEILYEARRVAAGQLTRRVAAVGRLRTALEVHLLITHLMSVYRSAVVDGKWELDQGLDVLVDLWFPTLTEAPAGEPSPRLPRIDDVP